METYCVSCKKYTVNEYSIIRKTQINAFIKLHCLWQEKINFFIKNQELSNHQFQMNKIIKKILLTGDKFMS